MIHDSQSWMKSMLLLDSLHTISVIVIQLLIGGILPPETAHSTFVGLREQSPYSEP